MNPLDYPICLLKPRRITGTSAWIGHIPFVMALIEAAKPSSVVELGTFTGESYCGMCQAVEHLSLSSRCFAVDTWEGDQHASFYRSSVFEDLRAHHDLYYSAFSTLLKKNFDDAVNDFGDASIDLLHIDGLHTYEAVKHDFETWRSKLSERSIVLFHDISERQEGFGVWRYWEELKPSYSTFEFTHSSGLGILVFGEKVSAPVGKLTKTANEEAQKLRDFYSKLGATIASSVPRQAENLEQVLFQHAKIGHSSKEELFIETGIAMMSVGETHAALREFQKALLCNHRNPNLHVALTATYLDLGLTRPFTKALGKCHQFSADGLILKIMGEIWERRNEMMKAIVSYESYLSLSNDDLGVMNSLILLYCQQQDFHKAADLCDRALKLNPDDPKLRQLGEMLRG